MPDVHSCYGRWSWREEMELKLKRSSFNGTGMVQGNIGKTVWQPEIAQTLWKIIGLTPHKKILCIASTTFILFWYVSPPTPNLCLQKITDCTATYTDGPDAPTLFQIFASNLILWESRLSLHLPCRCCCFQLCGEMCFVVRQWVFSLRH